MSGTQESNRTVFADVRLPHDTSFGEDELRRAVSRRLRIPGSELDTVSLVGRSLDARRRREIQWNCRVQTTLVDGGMVRRLVDLGVAILSNRKIRDRKDRAILEDEPSASISTSSERPVIVGSGPAGLFAAWLLSRHGRPPLVLERGKRIEERVRSVLGFERGAPHDPESNILFGEGGAGTFSDGKLTSRSRSPLVRLIYEVVVECTGPKDVLIDAKPHVGTDRLRAVLVHLRRKLEKRGVEFQFDSRVDDIDSDDSGVRAVILQDGRRIQTDTVLLGIGHSARDSYLMLRKRGVAMEFKPFQTGLRIEHSQEMINRGQHGEFHQSLPAAEYTLAGPGVRRTFSFCMCPGGSIVPSISEGGYLCTNGMSRSKRDGFFANSGLVFTVEKSDLGGGEIDPFAGIELQRVLEKRAYEMSGSTYRLPAQRVDDFLEGRSSAVETLKTSYPLGLVKGDLTQLIPGPARVSMFDALRAFERQIPGFSGESGVLVGPETRGSSPVRIVRDPLSRESTTMKGLYPIGEGAGFAGGIVSAAIDGLYSALAVLERVR